MKTELPPRYTNYALLFIGLLALWLSSGCAGKPRVIYQTVEVKVPVSVPCLSVTDIPPLPDPLPTMPADANAALSLSLARNFRWRAYGNEADALLRVCAGLVSP